MFNSTATTASHTYSHTPPETSAPQQEPLEIFYKPFLFSEQDSITPRYQMSVTVYHLPTRVKTFPLQPLKQTSFWLKPMCPGPVLHKKTHCHEKPVHRNEEQPPLATTRESPHSNEDTIQPKVKKKKKKNQGREGSNKRPKLSKKISFLKMHNHLS